MEFLRRLAKRLAVYLVLAAMVVALLAIENSGPSPVGDVAPPSLELAEAEEATFKLNFSILKQLLSTIVITSSSPSPPPPPGGCDDDCEKDEDEDDCDEDGEGDGKEEDCDRAISGELVCGEDGEEDGEGDGEEDGEDCDD